MYKPNTKIFLPIEHLTSIPKNRCLSTPNSMPPSIDEATGKKATLIVDYLLWADSGKPWAVIKAKRTTAERGGNQGR